jgi:Tfp pilus assembly protein FimV
VVTIPYWFIRYGLPAGFLLLVTVAILVARQPLHDEPAARAPSATAGQPAPLRPRRTRAQRPPATGYSVRSGDTLATIADRFGTTVDRLLALNPGIDPHALRVGQPVRVE